MGGPRAHPPRGPRTAGGVARAADHLRRGIHLPRLRPPRLLERLAPIPRAEQSRPAHAGGAAVVPTPRQLAGGAAAAGVPGGGGGPWRGVRGLPPAVRRDRGAARSGHSRGRPDDGVRRRGGARLRPGRPRGGGGRLDRRAPARRPAAVAVARAGGGVGGRRVRGADDALPRRGVLCVGGAGDFRDRPQGSVPGGAGRVCGAGGGAGGGAVRADPVERGAGGDHGQPLRPAAAVGAVRCRGRAVGG